MTGSARNGIVDGQAGIVKQHPAKGSTVIGHHRVLGANVGIIDDPRVIIDPSRNVDEGWINWFSIVDPKNVVAEPQKSILHVLRHLYGSIIQYLIGQLGFGQGIAKLHFFITRSKANEQAEYKRRE